MSDFDESSLFESSFLLADEFKFIVDDAFNMLEAAFVDDFGLIPGDFRFKFGHLRGNLGNGRRQPRGSISRDFWNK